MAFFLSNVDKRINLKLGVLLLVLLANGCAVAPDKPQTVVEQEPLITQADEQPVLAEPVKPLPNITIAAVGDIMLGTDFPDNRLPPGDGRHLLDGVTDTLNGVDVAFGNLEGGLFDGGEPFKKCSNPSLCYLFRSPARYVENLKRAGFDVVSLANNHARDFGEAGRSATMATLDAAGILHSGRAGDVASWQVNGVRVGLIAFAPFAGSHDMLNTPEAVRLITAFAQQHDVTLVSVHAGAEGRDALHLPFSKEAYHGENRGDVVKFAHLAVDAGADIVIGHGPHVPRAIELYRDRLIAYSLGNFATYRGFRISGENGLAPILLAELGSDGRFVAGRVVSARQYRPDGTRIDPRGRAARLMQQLTASDFPEGVLDIKKDGTIIYKQKQVVTK